MDGKADNDRDAKIEDLERLMGFSHATGQPAQVLAATKPIEERSAKGRRPASDPAPRDDGPSVPPRCSRDA